nr:hypothetical protein [Archangium violaceum]
MPSRFTATVWNRPAVMAMTPVRPGTCTGTVLLVVVPLPSWP